VSDGLTAAGKSASELEIDSVSVHFGGLTALDGVSIGAPPGRIIGVIGPNGAGKTTLFNVVCGFVRPDAGTLRWRGRSLAGVRPHQLARLGIARTLQGVRLFPHMSSIENVMVGGGHLHQSRFASMLLGLPRSDRAERALRTAALEALDEAGVADMAERVAGSLPYAVQKRVALARALVARPSLLLLDEPAGGLGADDVAGMAELLRSLRRSITVMLVEHRMDLVMSVCDDVAVLDAGAVIAHGTPGEVQADPIVLAAYLGERTDGLAPERASAASRRRRKERGA
jgi:branched-chain amino acid transport system ATP-binding protein